MPKPTIAAIPATAPTPMPAFAPVPSPLELEESGSLFAKGRLVAGDKFGDNPGAGDVVKPAGVTGRAVGVKDTPICLASDAAYAGGNCERCEDSHPTQIASARARPDRTRVVFVRVVYA
jgi:hypothetical protein